MKPETHHQRNSSQNLLNESKKQFLTEDKPKRQSIFSHCATAVVKKTSDLPSLRSSSGASGDLELKNSFKTGSESRKSSE
jgi:hypothetical protein